MPSSSQILTCACIGALVAFGTTPLLARLARRLGLVDNPAHRKIHKEPVPFLGGIAVFMGLFAAIVVACYLKGCLWSHSPSESHKLTFILGASAAAMLLGLLDDKFQVHARYKFLGQLFIVGMFVLLGYRFHVLSLPGNIALPLDYWGIPVTIFWMLAIINGVNLIDGIDGLAASVTTMLFVAAAMVAWCLNDTIGLWVASAAAAAIFGFLLRNWKPAAIYLGDAGSIGIGMLVSTSLVSLGQGEAIFSARRVERAHVGTQEVFLYQVAAVTLLAIYPALEVGLSVVRRSLRGKSIASADRGHIHHRLMQKGWSVRQVCLSAILLSAVAGASIVLLNMNYRGLAAMFLLASGVLLGTGLHVCGYTEAFSSFREVRPHFLIANYFVAMQREKLKLAQTVSEVIALINQTCIELGIQKYSLKLASPKEAEYNWQRPVEAHGSQLPVVRKHTDSTKLGFADQVELPDDDNRATWVFDPHDQEEDIDIEYRLLMSEFMKMALQRVEELYTAAEAATTLQAQNCDPSVLSSSRLKRRASQQRSGVLRAVKGPADPS